MSTRVAREMVVVVFFAEPELPPEHAATPAATISASPIAVTTRDVRRAGAPALEVTVSGGRGSVVGVFLGRRKIAGLSPGRKVAFEGVAARDGKRYLVFNPVYELLA